MISIMLSTLRNDSSNGEIYYYRGITNMELENYIEALSDFDESKNFGLSKELTEDLNIKSNQLMELLNTD